MIAPHERLQQARERAGYATATAAAHAFGWIASTYLGHENGSRGLRRDAAFRYAKAFGVSWAWLLGDEDAPFDEVTELLTAIPVVGILDPGAFRLPGIGIQGLPKEIHLQVFGYKASELEAYGVYGAHDHHFIISAKDGTPTLVEGDELVVSRTEGRRVEIAAWRLERNPDETVLKPAYAPHVSMFPEPLEMLDEENARVIGVVVAELRIKRRLKHPISDRDDNANNA